MFSNLRANSQIYILHKGSTPFIEVGTVMSVSMPRPKFPVPQFGQMQDLVVDVTAKVGERSETYQALPANLDVADSVGNDNVVVTTGRDAMNAEVASLKQKSLDIVNSVDYHRGIITECDKILENINPEYAEKQAQQARIATLESQLAEVLSLLKERKADSGE